MVFKMNEDIMLDIIHITLTSDLFPNIYYLTIKKVT
jgi:hypothetical protein